MNTAPSKTIKLATNIPLVGTVQSCYYAKSKTEGYSDQIKLKGTFDGQGEGSVYLPLRLVNDLATAGMLAVPTDKKDNYGNQAFQWLYGGKIQILKQEEGTRKFTTVTAAEKNGSPPIQQGDAHEPEPYDDGTNRAVDDLGEWWHGRYLLMKYCHRLAKNIHGDGEHDQQAVAATAHTLFIQANMAGKLAPRGDA